MHSLLFLLFTCVMFIHAYEALRGPTGVLSYSAEKSYQGFNLYAPMLTHSVFIINSEGDKIHEWTLEHFPGLYAELLPNGNLLAGVRRFGESRIAIGGYGRGIVEVDWEGNKVWQFDLDNEDSIQHHCFYRLSDDTTMVLGWERVSREDFGRKGFVPESVFEGGMNTTDFWLDFWVQVTHDSPPVVVKEWHLKDHLGEGYTKWDPEYRLPDALNEMSALYTSFDYSHFNALSMNEETGQVLMCSRNLGEIYLVDYETGEIIWRWGNPNVYDTDARNPGWYDDGDQILFGPHHATFLPNGNIQVFDNGAERGKLSRSRIVEVDPSTNEIVWEYCPWDLSSFYTQRQGAAQRLPNGNVLVTSTHQGHLFEVTPDLDVVWDFVNPWMMGGYYQCAILDGEESSMLIHGAYRNAVHRSFRYPFDYAGFEGKDMSVKGGLTPCPSFYRLYEEYVSSE